MSLPVKIQNCPFCKMPLQSYDFDFYDRQEADWEISVDTFSVTCHTCDNYFWIKLPYTLDEENIEIILEDEEREEL